MTKNLKEKWKEFYGLYGDIGRTEDDILLFIETLLQEQKEEFIEEIIEKIDAMIKEEESLPAQGNIEKTAEWYKIQALADIKKFIEKL